MQEVLYPVTENFYFEPFHFDWQGWEGANLKTLLLAPRGSLKTTVLTIARNVYKILRDFLLFGNCSKMIGIGSENKTKATAMVMAIRRHFENPRFQMIFGDLRGQIWREDQLTFKGAKLQEKEANVTAFGMDSSAVSSLHFTDLDIDDPVSFENSRTYQSRQKLWDRFFYDVLPTLQPNADLKELHIRGTRYHPDDLYGRQIKQESLKYRRDKAILDDGTSFCERMFPLELLRKDQKRNPIIFAAQYQNDVEIMREMSPIRQAWVQLFKFAELQRYGLYYQIAIDPGGLSESDETSGMGFSVTGTQTQQGQDFGKVFALESGCIHADTWQQAKFVIDMWEKYQRPLIVIEEVALQRVFQDIFKKEAQLRNHIWVNIEGIKSSELKDKIELARSVTPFFTGGQVYLDPERTPELYGKLEDYPQVGTDDVNALLINLKHLKDHWQARTKQREQIHEPEIVTSGVTGY